MYKPKMNENEKDFCCQMKHEQPVSMINLDPKLNLDERLLCSQCIENLESDQLNLIGFQKANQMIEEKRKKLIEISENLITKIIEKVESLQIYIISLRSSIIQKLDQKMDMTKNWILNLQVILQQCTEYSFFKELDLILMNKQIKDDHILKNQINQINNCWNEKISNDLELFKSFQEYQNCNEILSNLIESPSPSPSPSKQQQYLLQTPYKLQFIEDSTEQKEGCRAIVFDPTGKIMVSTSGKEIKIWNVDNGRIKLTQSLQGHQELVNCLAYSQIQNYFISGSSDKSITLWKYMNNKWQSSKRYHEHKGMIYSLILTSKEDQLISCSKDKSIKIWTVDFNNDQLKFLYTLEKHTGIVYSLSLNESEQILVSCGSDSIIIWQKGKNSKWKFLQIVKQTLQEIGCHVKFLQEDQFIWLPEKSNNLCVFEFQDGEFQENLKKRVCFTKNQGYLIEFNFPIIYNKDKNLIFLRHILHICILKVQNDGQLQIVQEFDCKHWCIYGTITNNGQFLIFWGGEKNKYETYEIQYQ